MAKAVLVMDMPYDCTMCKFLDSDEQCHAVDAENPWDTEPEKAKPDWCPLRELSERKETHTVLELHSNGQWTEGMKAGFNACMDEILGKGQGD